MTLSCSLLTGCKEDLSYSIPADIYSINFENSVFSVPSLEYTDDIVANSAALVQDDFQFVVNSQVRLKLGMPLDVSTLEFVKEYDYEKNGKITEYRETTGNYKVLVTEVADEAGVTSDYLLAVLTINKGIATPRGIRNGLKLEDVDYLMGDNTFTSDTKDGQENRVYSLNGYQLIINAKFEIVRSMQLIMEI